MRATIDRRDLIAALKATAPCRSANAHLPAIRCARIEASSGQVEITSTDLDLTIHKWVDATDVNNGVAVVPAAAVSAFLAACSTDKVTLDLGDRLTVTCGDASIASNVVPAEEWPRVPIVSGDEHHLDASTVEAIRLSARLEGMITDPVYEGKSMQGMIDLVQKGFFPKGSKVLYAHLGGAPALNGYSYTFRNG